ncbi:MAG: diadenosine tetraphosphate (Ap4A) HIT family hydrolase [Paraglaciecola psychrophila]|jgi:diadenosine tetraphosphate (Ap4A) HIT family hydrolase
MFALDPQLSSDTLLVGDLPLSRVLLMDDKNFPWLILVPRVENAVEIFQLSAAQQSELAIESALIAATMSRYFGAEKMNVAALGNVVAQLHVHHIARFKTDACWPKPVWGALAPLAYSGAERTSLPAALAELLVPSGLRF